MCLSRAESLCFDRKEAWGLGFSLPYLELSMKDSHTHGSAVATGGNLDPGR